MINITNRPISILVTYLTGIGLLMAIIGFGRNFQIAPPAHYPLLDWYQSLEQGLDVGSQRRTVFAFKAQSLESHLDLDEEWFESASDYWDLVSTTITADPTHLIAWGDSSGITNDPIDHGLRRVKIEPIDLSVPDDGYIYRLKVGGGIDEDMLLPSPPTELASAMPANSSLSFHVVRHQPRSKRLIALVRNSGDEESDELVTEPFSFSLDTIEKERSLSVELSRLQQDQDPFRFSLAADIADIDANSEFADPLSPRVVSVGRDASVKSVVNLAVDEGRSTEFLVLDPRHRHIAMVFFFDRPAEELVECRNYVTGDAMGNFHESGTIFSAVSDDWSPIICRFAVRNYQGTIAADILALSDYGRPSRKLLLEAIVEEVRLHEIDGVRLDPAVVLSISAWLADSMQARFSEHDIAYSDSNLTREIISSLVHETDPQAK